MLIEYFEREIQIELPKIAIFSFKISVHNLAVCAALLSPMNYFKLSSNLRTMLFAQQNGGIEDKYFGFRSV